MSSYLTDGHLALINHYFPGDDGRLVGFGIIAEILELLPADGSPDFGPAVAAAVRRVYLTLCRELRGKPLHNTKDMPGYEGENPGAERVHLAEALVILALENRRLLPDQYPQRVQ